MSIATPSLTNFTAGEISPRLEGRTDLSKYFNGCRVLENFLVHPHGGAIRRSGLRFVAEAMNPARPVLLIPFEFNASQTYVLELGEDGTGQGRMRVFTNHGVVLSDGEEYRRDIPYTADQFEKLRYAQSAEVLILVHPDHPVRKLTRVDHDDWTLEEMEFVSPPEAWTEGNYPSAVCFFEQRLVLAATPDRPGTLWFSRTGEMTDFRLRTREVPFDGWRDREIVNGSGEMRDGAAGDTLVILDGDGFEAADGLRGQHPDGTTRYYRYKGDKNYSASGADLTLTFETSPGAAGIEAIWDGEGALNEDCWECFEPGDRTDGPAGEDPLDDDAIEVTLSGRQANGIEFLEPRTKLWVGTAGGEWTICGSLGDAVTPASIKANQEGTCGASTTRPEAVGFATLYIQRAGRKVREMSYRLESDAYVSRDLTILSEHITAPGLVQLAWVQEPDAILYCLRSDGAVATLTYEPDQEVAAWSRVVTDGVVEGVASVFSAQSMRDELWTVVRREVMGEERRYIEYLEANFDGDIDEAFFVDSGLTYRGAPSSTIHGLVHLAGRTVAVLADGAVQTDRVVAEDGSITLDRPASVVHAGLPYVSRLQPMRLEAGSARGTAQTKQKRITKVAVRFHDTLGGKVGPDADTLETVCFRSSATPMGRSAGAWTGDKIVNFPRGWDRDGILTVVQDQPLPMTVLLIVPTLVINE
ncbi:hypothetical protein [Pseudodesulfovibrio sp.]|uniref:hypothetical protein n=1 Tax=Pseudodesulfovibrio sp. TaxID=2035812 RepID=UPI002603B64A|nr:hypothetical protein [Pseudodesulfovibrio sp.]MDD3311301.1 hypothetical protein [Pseudodesulfovibrio sp.]